MWIWGVLKYRQGADNSEWRARASLIGLSAPAVSLALWLVGLLLAQRIGSPATSDSALHRLTTIGGLWIPTLGLVSGLVGRPRLIPYIVPAAIGTALFWFATTLP
jgi:hypothetical protein